VMAYQEPCRKTDLYDHAMCHPHHNPLDAHCLSKLSVEFEPAPSEILIDGRLVEHWHAPEAELQLELMRRHNWTAD
jgi:hypothetical protein